MRFKIQLLVGILLILATTWYAMATPTWHTAVDFASTTVNSGQLNNTTSPITFGVANAAPFGSTFPMYAIVADGAPTWPPTNTGWEVISITAIAGNNVTATRPNPSAHSGSPTLFMGMTAEQIQEIQNNVNTIATTPGPTGPTGSTGVTGPAPSGTNQLVYANSGTAFALSQGTLNQPLLSNGSGGPPGWANETFPTSTTINRIWYSSANNVLSEIIAANNSVMTSSATGVPSWNLPGNSLTISSGVMDTVQDIRTTDSPTFAGLTLPTLGPAGVVGTNTTGLSLYIKGGPGNGSAPGGFIYLQTTPPGSSGATPETETTAVTIDNNQDVTFADDIEVQGTALFDTTSTFTGNDTHAGTATFNGPVVTSSTTTLGGTTTVNAPVIFGDNGTGTESAGSVTINKSVGVITSSSLTTAGGSTYTVTLNDTEITTTSMIMAVAYVASSSNGVPVVTKVTPTTNSATIIVDNNSSSAFNGTIQIVFHILKP